MGYFVTMIGFFFTSGFFFLFFSLRLLYLFCRFLFFSLLLAKSGLSKYDTFSVLRI